MGGAKKEGPRSRAGSASVKAYNAAYSAARVAAGICRRCKNPAAAGRRLCVDHLADEKRRYADAVSSGLCGFCRKVAALPGRKMCATCVKERNAFTRQNHKRRRAEFAALGLCGKCGDPPAPGKQTCERCLGEDQSRRESRSVAGRCPRCSDPVVEGKTACARHLEDANDRVHSRHKAGLCLRCPDAALPGSPHCASCSDRLKREKIERRAEALRRGVCFQCARDPAGPNGLCEECWLKGVARSALKSGKQWPDLRALWRAQDGRCALTGESLVPGTNASIDHIVPRSRGGRNEPSNLRWVALNANFAKRAMLDVEFVAMCRRVVATLPGLLHPAAEEPRVSEAR